MLSMLLSKWLTFRSLFIQAADTYLHITIEAIELIKIQPELTTSHSYSRGLAPWCLGRPTTGSINNAKFWGCGVRISSDIKFNVYNLTQVQAIDLGLSKEHDLLDFIDEEGVQLTALAPKMTNPSIEWQASSFGVSTRCRTLRSNSCDLSKTSVTNGYGPVTAFNCTKERAGIELSGNLNFLSHQIHFIDWHRFIQEPRPFEAYNSSENFGVTESMTSMASNLTDEQSLDAFNNPWHWISAVNIPPDVYTSIAPGDKEQRIWDIFGQSWQMMLDCNTTGLFSFIVQASKEGG